MSWPNAEAGAGGTDHLLAELGEPAARVDRCFQHIDRGLPGSVPRLSLPPEVEGPALSVGEIERFPDAKSLGACADLMPSVWQSAASHVTRQISKQGSKALRSALVQSAPARLSVPLGVDSSLV